MTPYEERDAQVVALIRREIRKALHHKEACGYREGTFEDSCLRYEIQGMMTILGLFDPNPHTALTDAPLR